MKNFISFFILTLLFSIKLFPSSCPNGNALVGFMELLDSGAVCEDGAITGEAFDCICSIDENYNYLSANGDGYQIWHGDCGSSELNELFANLHGAFMSGNAVVGGVLTRRMNQVLQRTCLYFGTGDTDYSVIQNAEVVDQECEASEDSVGSRSGLSILLSISAIISPLIW